MIKEIKYTGITNSPSDYDCPDGDLSATINIIPEDGVLNPIFPPKDLFTLPQGVKVIFIHKTTAFTHYIVEYKPDNNAFLKLAFFTEKNPENIKDILILNDRINSLSVLGNVLCIATDNNIKYAFWSEDKYGVFDSSKFKFDISLKYQNVYSYVPSENDNGKAISKKLFIEDIGNSYPTSNPMTEEQARNLFNTADAHINSDLSTRDKYTFKYISLGIAALKSFTGTYLSLSNVFILSPRGGIEYSSRLDLGNNRAIWVNYEPYKEKIAVNMNMKDMEEIISSIDIFLTRPFTLFDIDKKYNWKTGSSGMFFEMKSQDKIYEEIDSMVFRKSIYIDKKDFGKDLFLERVSDAGEEISLADFKRKVIGAKYTFSYNNRLNIANTIKKDLPLFDITVNQKNYQIQTTDGRWNGTQDGDEYWIPYAEDYPYANMYGQYADLYQDGTLDTSKEVEEKDVEVVVAIYLKENGVDQIQIHNAIIQYPLSPLLMFPNANAYKVDIYLFDSQRNIYRKKTIQLYQSQTFDMSLYLNTNKNRFPAFMQYRDVTIDINPNYDNSYGEGDITTKENGTWEVSTKEEFEQKKQLQETNLNFDESYIKFSEVNNPFIFPIGNTVSIGTSKILGICPIVKALSQGQFGQFPLYAFTNEGIWALEVSDTGSYKAKQPVTRDVCINQQSITQIDSAILFATDRGIMLISGSESKCITDILHGSTFSSASLPLYHKLLEFTNIPTTCFDYLQFKEYIKDANMAYDYSNQRVIVFRSDKTFAYIYSLKSKAWGMMQSNFHAAINAYPDSYIMTSDNKLANLSQQVVNKKTHSIIVTRPLKLEAADIFKTIDTSIHRGLFTKGHVKTALYGSRDLINWFIISSSNNHYLRGFRGTPFKYFRFVILTEFDSGECLSGTSISFTLRQNNKLR